MSRQLNKYGQEGRAIIAAGVLAGLSDGEIFDALKKAQVRSTSRDLNVVSFDTFKTTITYYRRTKKFKDVFARILKGETVSLTKWRQAEES